MTQPILADIPNHLDTIDEIYVFVTKDATGNEGVAAASVNGQILPLVAADQARVDSLRGFAQQIADMSGCEIKLCKFSRREVVEVIDQAKTRN